MIPSDVVTLIYGKHILHFGGEFLFYRDNSTAWGNTNGGTLTYTGVYTASTQGDSTTGLAYADFLLGQTQNWTRRRYAGVWRQDAASADVCAGRLQGDVRT